MAIELNKIYNRDCLEGMKQLEEQSVDVIIADPPYQISKPSQFSTLKDRTNQRTGTYFGEWDDNFDNQPWIKESFRVIKKGGSLLVFNDLKKISIIIDIAIQNGYLYKDTIIWNKSNPMPRNRDRRYVQDIEVVLWFIKPGGKWIFNRQEENYESCIKRFPSESGGGYKRIHPTQKPLKLIENLMKIHSNENQIILDPFMGSATTAIAAINLNRIYIGFEIGEKYYKSSVRRINNHARKL